MIRNLWRRFLAAYLGVPPAWVLGKCEQCEAELEKDGSCSQPCCFTNSREHDSDYHLYWRAPRARWAR